VQLPMRLAVSWLGHPFSLIASANCSQNCASISILLAAPKQT